MLIKTTDLYVIIGGVSFLLCVTFGERWPPTGWEHDVYALIKGYTDLMFT